MGESAVTFDVKHVWASGTETNATDVEHQYWERDGRVLHDMWNFSARIFVCISLKWISLRLQRCESVAVRQKRESLSAMNAHTISIRHLMEHFMLLEMVLRESMLLLRGECNDDWFQLMPKKYRARSSRVSCEIFMSIIIYVSCCGERKENLATQNLFFFILTIEH